MSTGTANHFLGLRGPEGTRWDPIPGAGVPDVGDRGGGSFLISGGNRSSPTAILVPQIIIPTTSRVPQRGMGGQAFQFVSQEKAAAILDRFADRNRGR